MKFGDKIAQILTEKQRTQRWLAKKALTSPNTISKIIKGSDTSYTTAINVAHALYVDANWLLDDDQGWPPPESSTLTNMSQQELVAELARRRELIRKDMRSIAAKFTDHRLVHIDRLCSLKRLSDSQQIELQGAFGGLLSYFSMEIMLQWLDPDAVHPTDKLPKAEKLIEGYIHLSAEISSARAQSKMGLIPSPLAVQRRSKRSETPRYDRDGGTFPHEARPYQLVRSRSRPKPRTPGKKPAKAKPKRRPRS